MVSQDGTWKMRNVVINGINIGKLFRDQFAQAMQENQNDLDKVINNWTDTVARARQGSSAS
jgi:phospholipid transport system substrate-binding protein